MWHQVLPYLPGEALASGILTVLIALTDAVVENGCLLVIAGSHRHRSETLTCHVIDTPGESNYIAVGEPAPGSVLKDAQVRTGLWEAAREAIMVGDVARPIFETARRTRISEGARS